VTDCPRTDVLQDYLEELLAAPERATFEAHLRDCPVCAVERVRLERLFDALDAMPLEAPSPAMAERVLDRVLPSRTRARWAQRLGFGYAGALAASVGGAALWMTQPSGHAFFGWVTVAASSRLLHSLLFVMNELAFLALRVAGGWTVVTSLHARVNPLMKVAATLANYSALPMLLASSAAACLALLWWMRGRRHGGKGMHLGLLGF
jgi:Putative zinc-finger